MEEKWFMDGAGGAAGVIGPSSVRREINEQ